MSRDDIDRVLAANDIYDVISRYVDLKRSGKNYKGICPFHDEKTPSFNVNPQEQYFKCFGCGEGGDVIHFLMKLEGLNFPEALSRLADRGGVELENNKKKSTGIKEKLHRVNKWAMKLFRHILWEKEEGQLVRDYLDDRNITRESAEKWKLGMAPSGWENLLKAAKRKGISTELLKKSGLISRSRKSNGFYDRFRRRLMFPIVNRRKKVVGFGGRILPGEDGDAPKYLNTPENPVFQKRKLLYGWGQCQRKQVREDGLWVAEGYTDVIMAHQYDYENVVATLGTSFTRQHVKYFRNRVDDIYFLFDSDTAGQKASERTYSLFLEEDTPVRIGCLPEDEDPCSLLESGGREALRTTIDEAEDLIDFRIRAARDRYDTGTIEGKMKVANEILDSISGVDHSVRTQLIIRKLSETLGVREWRIRKTLKKKQQNSRQKRKSSGRNGTGHGQRRGRSQNGTTGGGGTVSGIQRATRMLLAGLLMEEGEAVQSMFERVSTESIPVERCRSVYDKIEDAHEEQETFDISVSQLLSRIQNDSLRHYVLELVDEYDRYRPENPDEFLEDNFQYLRNHLHKETLQSLKKQMSEAYREGDQETYQELKEEVSSIQQLIRNVSVYHS